MARTIHDTWGVANRAERSRWSDPAIPKAIAKEMWANWRRQQSLRKGERRRRQRGALQPQPVNPHRLRIIVEHEAPHLFHAATDEDIRNVLRRMPYGWLDGLQEIRLCLDRGGRDDEEATARDPFTGRLRTQYGPGVFAPYPLGTYYPRTGTIRLYGWLCDSEARAPVAMLLKLQALRVLVHEVAHHFDHAFRKGRSRWDLNDKRKHEDWAERMERELATSAVFPYIARRYAAEMEQLERWLEKHGGASVRPLQVLYYDGCAYLTLLRAVAAGVDSDTAKGDFASALHRAGANDYARAVVAEVLGRNPEHAGALSVSACILQCEKREFAAAEPLCRRALAADPSCLRAWDVLVRGYAIQKRWQEAATACESAIVHTPDDGRPWPYFVSVLAEAHLHLRDWSSIEADAVRLRHVADDDTEIDAEVHRVMASCWREAWDEALRRASSLLAAGKAVPGGCEELWLMAAKFESAHRLGLPNQAGSFGAAKLRQLEDYSVGENWAKRIREIPR